LTWIGHALRWITATGRLGTRSTGGAGRLGQRSESLPHGACVGSSKGGDRLAEGRPVSGDRALEPTTEVSYVVPVDQPNTVREIAERLFPAYTVEAGGFHLAGCKLEDHPFVRLEFQSARGVSLVYVDAQGREADAALVSTLGMANTTPLETDRRLPERELERMIQCGTRIARQKIPEAESATLSRVDVICCRYAHGKIRFTVGDQSADLRFSGWARQLEPPPFVCPYTGIETFHLAATDEGQIAAAEAIQTCAITGRRVLPDALRSCSVTGVRALAEFFATCPVSGKAVLEKEMVPCSTCGQMVSPMVVTAGRCAACQSLAGPETDDPRISRLTQAYPSLSTWPRWQLAETATVLIVVLRKRLRRLLLVLDKDTLEPRRVAAGSRLTAGWSELEPSRLREVLDR